MPKVTIPHLSHQRPSQIQKLVLLVVRCLVRVVWGEVIRCDPVVANDGFLGTNSPYDELVQHVVCALGVHMLLLIHHRVLDVPSGMLEDELFTAGMVREEIGNVKDFTPIGNPAAALGIVSQNIRGSVNANALGHGGVKVVARRVVT